VHQECTKKGLSRSQDISKFARLERRQPFSDLLFQVLGKKRSRLCDHAGSELRIANKRGSLHRMSLLVVVDAGLALFVEQHIGDHRRRQLRRTPILDVRCKWRKNVFRNEAEERVCVSPETGPGSKARLDGIEVDARYFAG
jgi:hypothetical protein